jgi:predicted nucleic acid-binding protein
MKRICVDTNILGWFYKGTGNPDDEDNVERAQYLFQWFSESNMEVVIPSIVLAEMLCDISDSDEREEATSYLSSEYEVIQFDTLCALEYSRLRIIYEEKNREQFSHPENTPKCKILNDYLICAAAISDKCDVIFTNNVRDFSKFANSEIPILSLEYVDEIKAEKKKKAEQLAIEKQIEKEKEEFGKLQFPDDEERQG